ncbi:tRNA epoxyqueuosine(34) reductase QueG [Aestuariivirga litoralis]|uniref:tRNA epoxyqueuosine(34) reductase QueG n=1 Tax=Aestuariivirga litoralis TaxID=2650924 RepID=UPI0018C50CB1|nr:tRNA epoxyqueuosine(34) reductase QueG [Aestuariivirga litoralis]MBG1232938.1 tRNA epoxyqueuosine(34) reductase QueG [Aestuariivirga litoralis]
MPSLISDLATTLRDKAKAEGFDGIGITSANLPAITGANLQAFVSEGRHGSMEWLAETAPRRASPDALWPGARSAIVLAMNYGQGLDAFARLEKKSEGVISTYALNRDYHDVIKGKLKRLASWFALESRTDVKVFVDTAALMEKPLAQLSGLGWQGKHTNLVSKELGSWFFLGVILTEAELPHDSSEQDHCGSCRACLDVCPTQAFTATRQIDARRCISYLTIEHKGAIPAEFRKAMGNRIYGCDDCLAICPWNKFAKDAQEMKFAAREDLIAPPLADFLLLDDGAFRRKFSGSPVKRIGRNRFIRNCVIAAGNSGDQNLLPQITRLKEDADEVVREAASWALQELSA